MPRTASTTRNAPTTDVCAAILSGRKFGVEIEFVGIARNKAIEIISAIPGVRCRQSDAYGHQNSHTDWKVTTDGSVSVSPNMNAGHCGEVVSPILSGAEGLEQVRKVVKALAQAGATANRSCGLHVHVDATGLTGTQVVNVLTRYNRYESEIDAFMPSSRRRNNNSYCRSLTSYIDAAGNLSGHSQSAVVRAFYERYMKVNVQSLSRHGTVEFRHHSGSVNADKICNWIQFCVNFLHVSVNGVASGRGRRSGARTARPGRVSKTHQKMAKIVNLLQNRGLRGATVEELRTACATLGSTSATSVVVMVSNLRSQFGWSIKKTGHVYFIRRTGRMPGVDAPSVRTQSVRTESSVSTSDSGVFMGLPAHIIAFYQERQQELAA